MTNLDSISKNRDIILLKKVCIVKAMVFCFVLFFSRSHIRMWEFACKKAGCWRIDAFRLWWWRSLMTVPWTSRRSKKSILKEINPEHSLEGLMLKLKLQYFDHLMWITDSLEKLWCWEKLKAKEEDGCREWDAYEFEKTPGDSKGQGNLLSCSPWGYRVNTTLWLSNENICYILVSKIRKNSYNLQ